jgi:hypothetical protein
MYINMNEDNNLPQPSNTEQLDDLLTQFSILDFRENPMKTYEDIKAEFPCINYDYGTATYYAHKYPYMPDNLYSILEDLFNENNISTIKQNNARSNETCVQSPLRETI